MEYNHLSILKFRFGEELLAGKKLVCMYIPDDYQFEDQDLIRLIKNSWENYLKHQ